MSKENYLESAVVAKYFGFSLEKPEEVTKDDIKNTKAIRKDRDYLDDNLFPIEEAAAILRKFNENVENDIKYARAIYFEGSASGSHKKHRKSGTNELVNLHFINSEKSIVDALVIKTTEAILRENGAKNILIRINSIGGKEAQNAYNREATAYYRKNINDLNVHCRQLFKESIHSLITKGRNQCTQIHEEAPKPMDFLGEDSRKHFGEIIECLDILDVQYQIDPMVLGDPNYSSHTVFEIIDTNNNEVLAAGSRYNLLSKKIGLKKDISAIGVTINLSKPKKAVAKLLKKIDESKFFFMQIGSMAKMKTLLILDDLRKSGIPIKHTLHRDRLTNQIAAAKRSKAEYIIIMGQKEAIDDELIVRDKDNRKQASVKREDLVKYLKGCK